MILNHKNYLQHIAYSQELDIDSSCSAYADNDSICSDQCGEFELCSTTHHKSNTKLLKKLVKFNTYTCRFVGYALCSKNMHLQPNEIETIYGSAYPRESNMLVTVNNPRTETTTQHEMSHTLGTQDDQCTPNQFCVLKNDKNYWCDSCITAINKFVSERENAGG